MAYDELTADRFRKALGDMGNITEKRMMGGVCFMLNGNMIGGADRSKEGSRRFMFRIGKDNQADGVAMPGAVKMEQGGRMMRGFFFVKEESCDDALLQRWIDLTTGFAKELPAK